MNGEYDFEFGILLDALENEPHKVSAIVNGSPSILEATNRAGENALRWFALENRFEEVRKLRALGSSIHDEALSEAIALGNTEMVGLLFELGVEPDLITCRDEIRAKRNELTSRQKNIIRNHFRDFGHEI